ncbi:MAG: hypothetical protein WAQ99_07560 [Pyrinomonadaceae bacterium]
MMLVLMLQSAAPTFWEKAGWMLFEKLGVGVVVMGAVVAGQWMIERYKARRAVWTEISKERVKRIAEDWNEMNKWDGIVGDLYAKLQSILESGRRNPGTAIGGRPELSETIEFLSTFDLSQISSTLTEDCKAELAPLIKQSEEQATVVSKTLQANRFWLGKDLYTHCREFQKTLHNICVSFGKMDFSNLKDLAEELNHRREDVLTTLKSVK